MAPMDACVAMLSLLYPASTSANEYQAPPWPPAHSPLPPPSPTPPSPDCTQPAGNCWDTLCCVQPPHAPVYGCFRREGRDFAQCRPKYGWFNHTEVLSGTCEDDNTWKCPDSWLEKNPEAAKEVVPQKRANLTSKDVVMRGGTWDYSCSDEFDACLDTKCCANPRFGCYKRSGRHFAQCRPLVADCVDWDWLCPGWETCGGPNEDCTTSLCCQSTAHPYACFRRPVNYYAQCRVQKETTCTTWQAYQKLAIAAVSAGRPPPDAKSMWLCPGWEECSGEYEECTLSRCCSDKENFACFLNKSSTSGRWFAQCRPNNVTELGLGSVISGGWLSPDSWMTWRDGMWDQANQYAESRLGIKAMGPAAVATLVILAVMTAMCTVGCAIFLRLDHIRKVRALESELKEMGKKMERIQNAKATEQNSGNA